MCERNLRPFTYLSVWIQHIPHRSQYTKCAEHCVSFKGHWTIYSTSELFPMVSTQKYHCILNIQFDLATEFWTIQKSVRMFLYISSSVGKISIYNWDFKFNQRNVFFHMGWKYKFINKAANTSIRFWFIFKYVYLFCCVKIHLKQKIAKTWKCLFYSTIRTIK